MKHNSATIASLLLLLPLSLSVISLSTSITQAAIESSACEMRAEEADTGAYSQKQLQTLASRIKVKLIGDNNGGSGTLIARQANTYLVLTNQHVICGANSIRLQTFDGQTYPVQIVANTNFEKHDLALSDYNK
ncbi:serine protease, partial [Nostoc sp. ChiQUE01b]|uniref:S1 family peptidase n=1 Tax=Nostoc sp. ChiQUE01b TaxID=3075376 RepID=UPI002AD36A35